MGLIEEIDLSAGEVYTDSPMNVETGAVLLIPHEEQYPVVYIDTARIIISPKKAVRKIELGQDSDFTREFTKFVYDGKGSREYGLSYQCDENARTLIENVRRNIISKLQEERRKKLN